MLRHWRGLLGYVNRPRKIHQEKNGDQSEERPRGLGTQLTLFHVEHIHCPEELGLPIETTLSQASQAVQMVVQGHKAGECPLTGNVGEFGPGPRLYVKDLEGIDCILRLSSPWRWEQGTWWTKKKKSNP